MFNAIRYTKTLEAVGFSREQAEATIDVFLKFMEHNFATKEDVQSFRLDSQKEFQAVRNEFRQEIQEVKNEISETRTSLRSEISELRTEMRHSLISLEQRMTIKMGALQAASIGILAALIKFF